jgi:hypothetical protein
MFEQALLQRMDYALILLHIEIGDEDKNEDEDYDPDERRTSKGPLRFRRGW